MSPRRRSTGRPISVATAAPTSPAPSSPSRGPSPSRAVIEPPTAAPIADERHLPEADLAGPPGEHDQRQRDDRVDQRDRGEVGAALAQERRDERERAPRRDQQHEPDGVRGPPGARASSRGTGRGSRTARQVDGSRRPRRPGPAGVTTSATSTMTNSTGLDVRSARSQPHTTDCSTMPSPIAATTIVGSRSIPPITAAASAAQQDRRPEHGAEREPDDPGAEEHRRGTRAPRRSPRRRVSARRTGMPSSAARSAFVGACRAPRRRRGCAGTARARRTRPGSAIAATTSLPPKRTGPTVNDSVDRRREALRRRGHVEPAGEQQPEPGEHLREADGGDA